MAAPLPAPIAVSVTGLQLVTAIARSDNPTLTAMVWSSAVLGYFCVGRYPQRDFFSTIINLRKPLASKGDCRISLALREFLPMAVALVMLKDDLSEVHDGQM
jgi:hypothetical protein